MLYQEMMAADHTTRFCKRTIRAGGIRGQRHPFTLLETMIAVALLLMLTILLMACAHEVTKSWGRLTREHDLFTELLALDRIFDSVLSNAVPFVWRDEDNKPIPAFMGEPGRFRLAYRHRLNNLDDGATRFMGLTLEGEQLKAYYQERPFFTWEKSSGTVRESLLAEGVQSLRCRYADWLPDDKKIEWVEEWDPERLELPLAIMISIEWVDGRQESWLRRTAGNSRYERFGNWRPKTKP